MIMMMFIIIIIMMPKYGSHTELLDVYCLRTHSYDSINVMDSLEVMSTSKIALGHKFL
jgi:hypothetical protein